MIVDGRSENLNIEQGAYVRGKRDGHWTFKGHFYRYSVDYREGYTTESGPYVDDLRQGSWTVTVLYDNDLGRGKRSGPYVNGKKHGRWVRTLDTIITEIKPGVQPIVFSEGTFVNGKTHGRWVWKYKHGYEFGGTCSGGKATGKWWSSHPKNGTETWYIGDRNDELWHNFCKQPLSRRR